MPYWSLRSMSRSWRARGRAGRPACAAAGSPTSSGAARTPSARRRSRGRTPGTGSGRDGPHGGRARGYRPPPAPFLFVLVLVVAPPALHALPAPRTRLVLLRLHVRQIDVAVGRPGLRPDGVGWSPPRPPAARPRLPVSSSATTSLSSSASSKSDCSRSVSESSATASDPDSSGIGGISKSVSKMSPLSSLVGGLEPRRLSRLDPPGVVQGQFELAVRVRGRRGACRDFGATVPGASRRGPGSSESSKSTSESLSVSGFFAADRSDSGFRMPDLRPDAWLLRSGSFRGVLLLALLQRDAAVGRVAEVDPALAGRGRPPVVHRASCRGRPRRSSRRSVCSSKSSLSASRLSSNSLLSPSPWFRGSCPSRTIASCPSPTW